MKLNIANVIYNQSVWGFDTVEDIAVQFAIYRNGVMDSDGKDIVRKETLEGRQPEKALFQHFKNIKGL
jgi:hypothetical protein